MANMNLLHLVLLLQVLFAVVIGYEETGDGQDIDTRIYNGMPTTQAQFKFIVYMKIAFTTTDGPDSTACTGFIGSRLWIITAAHCVNKKVMNRLKASGGPDVTEVIAATVFTHLSHQQPDHEQNRNQMIQPSNFFYPPDTELYIRSDSWYGVFTDIALIKLEQPLQLNSEPINFIPLMSTPFPDTKQYCISLGFGMKSDTNRDNTLHYTYVQGENCPSNVTYPGSATLSVVGRHKRTNICPGDSGSPLVCKGTNGDYIATGVAQGGFPNMTGSRCTYIKETRYVPTSPVKKWMDELSQGEITFIPWK